VSRNEPTRMRLMTDSVKLLALIAVAHTVLTLACIVYAGAGTLSHFDTPDVREWFGTSAARASGRQ
jgi:hypothetical protein